MEIFLNILFAFIVLGFLGCLFGVGLAAASKVFAVEKDQRILDVDALLPGVNCGACGYAGCSSYAEAVVLHDADMTLCSPGGPEVIAALGKYMGVELDTSGEKMVAYVHCQGGRDITTKGFDYHGLEDCNAMKTLFDGDKDCKFGCLGAGSCIKVCPVDAIKPTANGLVLVNPDKCISCEKCIVVCPTGVMKMIPYSASHAVACNSTDKGAAVRKYCNVGCIGCKICAKKSSEGGFIIEDFLAHIDYTMRGEREEAKNACPTKCIVRLQPIAAKEQRPTTNEASVELQDKHDDTDSLGK